MSAYKVDENSEAVYRGIFDQMNKLHKEGNEESASKAEGIALELITHAELPLLFRAHAHMVLGSGNGNYLFHAQEAVRVVKKGIDLFGPDQGTSKLLKDAEEVLRYAKHDHKQLQEQMKAREAEGWEYVDPEDVEEGEEIDVLRYGGDVIDPAIVATTGNAGPASDVPEGLSSDLPRGSSVEAYGSDKPEVFGSSSSAYPGQSIRKAGQRANKNVESTAASSRPRRQPAKRTQYDPATGETKEI